jgi:hypothetical protein
MNFSFFMVAAMLFIHGALYYFRESEDDEKEHAEKHGSVRNLKMHDEETAPYAAGSPSNLKANPAIELYDVGSSSTPGGNNGVDGVQKPAPHRASLSAAAASTPQTVKQHVKAWWRSLVPTRKQDVVWIVLLTCFYTIGVAIILGRKIGEPISIYAEPGLPGF